MTTRPPPTFSRRCWRIRNGRIGSSWTVPALRIGWGGGCSRATPMTCSSRAFMARLQVRAAEQPNFATSNEYQELLWQDGLLLHHGAAQVVVERIRDGKEGIGLIALGAKPADVWSGLCEALELTRAVLDECCPGVVLEEWAIGKGGARSGASRRRAVRSPRGGKAAHEAGRCGAHI